MWKIRKFSLQSGLELMTTRMTVASFRFMQFGLLTKKMKSFLAD